MFSAVNTTGLVGTCAACLSCVLCWISVLSSLHAPAVPCPFHRFLFLGTASLCLAVVDARVLSRVQVPWLLAVPKGVSGFWTRSGSPCLSCQACKGQSTARPTRVVCLAQFLPWLPFARAVFVWRVLSVACIRLVVAACSVRFLYPCSRYPVLDCRARCVSRVHPSARFGRGSHPYHRLELRVLSVGYPCLAVCCMLVLSPSPRPVAVGTCAKVCRPTPLARAEFWHPVWKPREGVD